MSMNFDEIRAATRAVDRLDDRMIAVANEVFNHRIQGLTLGGGGGGGSPYQFAFQSPSVGQAVLAIASSAFTLKSIQAVSNYGFGTLGGFLFRLSKAIGDPLQLPTIGPPGSPTNPFVPLHPGNIGQTAVTGLTYFENQFVGWTSTSLAARDVLFLSVQSVTLFNQVAVEITF